MRYIMLVLLSAGLIFSGNPRLAVKPMAVDDDASLPGISYGLRDGIVLDSAPNQYSLISTPRELIAYNGTADAIGVVTRNYSIPDSLHFHSADGALSFWLYEPNVYNGDYGRACYPAAIAANAAPYLSFTYLYNGAWGGAGALYCSGGWFSGLWDPAVDIGPGNQYVQTCIGKEMPNGNMTFILYGTSPFCMYYRTYNADLSTLLAQGQLTPDATYYWGWDSNLNGGIAYVFYCDDNLNVYYRTSTDGITWTTQASYNLVWPNPYTNNLISLNTGVQACVTDAGDPVLVFDCRNGDDGTYPPYSKVYVSTASGQPCTKVSPDFGAADSECYYVGITTGGNSIGVIYCMPRNNQDDSLTWNDVYYTQSNDGGATWSTPVNQTADHTRRTSIPQVAKRLDAARNRAYILYGQTRLPSQDMDLMWAYDAQVAVSIHILFQTVQVGIEENKTETSKTIALSVTPNPAMMTSKISYALPTAGYISLRLYGADGRLVKTLDQGFRTAGTHIVNMQDLANGLYFIRLETPTGSASRSMVFVK